MRASARALQYRPRPGTSVIQKSPFGKLHAVIITLLFSSLPRPRTSFCHVGTTYRAIPLLRRRLFQTNASKMEPLIRAITLIIARNHLRTISTRSTRNEEHHSHLQNSFCDRNNKFCRPLPHPRLPFLRYSPRPLLLLQTLREARLAAKDEIAGAYVRWQPRSSWQETRTASSKALQRA